LWAAAIVAGGARGAHKGQPRLEKRFEQLKTVHEIAPVFLKNPSRIEAFFTVYFLALLLQAFIERELRQAMKRERLKALPLYPEERRCARPTTEQLLRLFSHAERHLLSHAGRPIRTFEGRIHAPSTSGPQAARHEGERIPRLTAARKFAEITSAMCGK
jgi:hypothetical protein